jgi:hypothetical protein
MKNTKDATIERFLILHNFVFMMYENYPCKHSSWNCKTASQVNLVDIKGREELSGEGATGLCWLLRTSVRKNGMWKAS